MTPDPSTSGRAAPEFWPQAMLPAWYVTDANLVIRSWNPFGKRLAESFQDGELLGAERLSIDWSPPKDYKSLWETVLRPDGENLGHMQTALATLKKQRGILEAARQTGGAINLREVAWNLRQVQGTLSVRPYFLVPDPGSDYLQIGVKISPPQGLELRKEARLEDVNLSFVDVVMAYRVKLEWNGSQLAKIVFWGTQPAIHDASDRHKLWVQQKERETAEISGFLAHAFKTPLSSISRNLKDMQNSRMPIDLRSRIAAEACEVIEDVMHLTHLVLFVRSREEIDYKLRLAAPGSEKTMLSISDITNCFAGALRSIHSNRTDSAVDIRKIDLMFSQAGLSPDTREEGTGGFNVYRALAEKLTCIEGIAPDAAFAIEVSPSGVVAEHPSEEMRTRFRTSLIDLMLAEIMVNAIKYASEENPEVGLAIKFRPDVLAIEVRNNGMTLTKDQFSTPGDRLAKVQGEKRKALGLILNKQIARLIGADLKWCDPGAEAGTRLALEIQIRN